MNIETVQQEMRKLGKIRWFGGYQTIRVDGEILTPGGWRDKNLNRLSLFKTEDFKDKTVLDIGCSMGGHCINSIENGASSVYGTDCMEDTIEYAKGLAQTINMDINYCVSNIKYKNCVDIIKSNFGVTSFDTVLFLSVFRSCGPPIAHGGKTEAGNPNEEEEQIIFDNLNALTKNVLYFEGHGQDAVKYYEELFDKYLHAKIELLGITTDSNVLTYGRPFFRCLMD